MRDGDSEDTPVVLLRPPLERELPAAAAGRPTPIGVTTGPHYCDDCYVAEHSRAPMPRGNLN